jgi:hypothetical protein
MVACRLDPIGKLFASNQISQHQRDAAEAYQADVEAWSLRAPSRGPDDVGGWRGHRPAYNTHSKRSKRMAKAKDALKDQAKTITAALAGQKVNIRQLGIALDVLAEVYGFSTMTRH